MTLILTVANSSGVHQSSDYQLTDPGTGAPVSDRAGSKQLDAEFKGLNLQLAFTGVASVRTGSSTQRTIDWLSAELKALPQDSSLQDICNALSKRGAAAMKPLGPRGVLTLILACSGVGEPFRVAVVSNAHWGEHPPRAKDHFDIAIHVIKKPFSLISGFRDSVPPLERHRIRALARASAQDIQDGLAAINAIAAGNSQGYVSKECWVTSQQASNGGGLRFAAINVGEQKGLVTHVRGGFDVFDWVKKNFRAAPGKEIGLRQRVSMMIPGQEDVRPVPPPEGDSRKFTLSGSSATGPLLSASGQHCASVEIAQLECVIIARRNEEVTVPFARVKFSGTHPMCADFPRPLLPWPSLTPSLAVDGVSVPQGCQYTVGYWVEHGVHQVVLPQTSRGIRNLAFLGDDDELVIVVPPSNIEFAWEPSRDGPTATLQANIWWRTRLDGTRGTQ
jgi:hypothetical protein